MIDILNAEKIRIINEIVTVINDKKLDIIALCERLFLTIDDFIDLLKSPNKKVSIYLEILEIVKQS